MVGIKRVIEFEDCTEFTCFDINRVYKFLPDKSMYFTLCFTRKFNLEIHKIEKLSYLRIFIDDYIPH